MYKTATEAEMAKIRAELTQMAICYMNTEVEMYRQQLSMAISSLNCRYTLLENKLS